MGDAAVARSLGDSGVVLSGVGVRPSVEGGRRRRRRERREWRGGRMSKSWGGGSVLGGWGSVDGVGMMWSVKVRDGVAIQPLGTRTGDGCGR